MCNKNISTVCDKKLYKEYKMRLRHFLVKITEFANNYHASSLINFLKLFK